MEFFETTKMCKAINCTTITLIPKVKNPTNIKEFMPILTALCCRMITDNIIISHELVNGYGRKNISPRCMLKIDIQKTYDSVEWVYIEQVMKLLGFPEKFVKWIMACISTIAYSVIIMGSQLNHLREGKDSGRGIPYCQYYL
ncbi:uncharacterized protein [Nicotiana sylvestris]|uniref:Uncharacterized protein LOC104219483 n=1 Tax=Nicotiana sylvestris TaxID=4096 RepID=A0A1U7VU51_NICSY|nr:PREDICTED: uncharacterized protein LOC104219483 [Nicotiana sylvestris]